MKQVLKSTRVITPTSLLTMPTALHIEDLGYARSGIKLDREPQRNPVKITILKNEQITIHSLD